MKSKRLFTAIGNIDDRFISEDAGDIAFTKQSKMKHSVKCTPWLRFAVPLAACLVIAFGIFAGQNSLFIPPNSSGDTSLFIPPNNSGDTSLFVPPNSTADNPSNDNQAAQITPDAEDTTPGNAVTQVAYGFAIGDRLYFPISFDDRKKFGLVPQEDFGATPNNYYVITEGDLGEIIGVVENSANESLMGATVYHFAAFPDSYAICIVDRGEKASASERDVSGPEIQLDDGLGWGSDSGYEFYTFGYIMSLDGASSDIILSAYEMSIGAVHQVAVLASDCSPVVTISDETSISALLEVLQGHEDIGLTAHEEMMVNWLSNYDPNWRDNDHRFMALQQRLFRITNKDTGLELSLIYNPFIKSLCIHDSYYILTEESAVIMNELLMVSQ